MVNPADGQIRYVVAHPDTPTGLQTQIEGDLLERRGFGAGQVDRGEQVGDEVAIDADRCEMGFAHHR